jgi:serine/threonine-protein kinase
VAIDGYRIDGLAGSGPLTAVYRGVLESHQQQVVLKVLHASLASNELLVQRFLQAANAARLVTHDRVLPCYDVGQSNGWVYLACEHFEGRTLAEMAGSGAMDRQRAVYLAWQAAMGIEAIHAVGQRGRRQAGRPLPAAGRACR